MPRRLFTTVLILGVLAVAGLIATYARPATAAPAGAYIGTGVDLTVSPDGKTVSLGYTIASPKGGCAAKVQAFGAPLLSDLTGFRITNDRGIGVLAGRPTPNEAVTVIGMWDGFTQFASVGLVTTEPSAGTDCTPLRAAWRAVGDGAPTLGANPFTATGPATLVGSSTPGGTVQLKTNVKVDGLESLSVTFQQGACSYNRSTTSADYGIGQTSPLMYDSGPSFFGPVGFGTIGGVQIPGGARGVLIVNGTGDCPTIALTYVATEGGTITATPVAPLPPLATPTPAASPTPIVTPTPAAPPPAGSPTPVATSTATGTPAASPTPVTTPTPPAIPAAPPGLIGTPIFGVSGQALAVFSGGPVDSLETSAKTAGATGVWVQDASGGFKLLVVGGPSFINDAFRTSFAGGLAANTPLTLTR